MSGHAKPMGGRRVIAGIRRVMLVFRDGWMPAEQRHSTKGTVGLGAEEAASGIAAPAEKQAIITACEALINNVLKPRCLPEIKPTDHTYPIDLYGDWRAGRYRFVVRFRSGFPENMGEEFDAPFARI